MNQYTLNYNKDQTSQYTSTGFTDGLETRNKPVYGKIQRGKTYLLHSGIQKSGKNNYQKYDYFELKDIEPPILEFMEQENMTSRFNFTESIATLVIRDEDSDTEAYYTLPLPPVKETDTKRAMQETGSIITYSMRYLYIMAFEIVVPDTIDASDSKQRGAKKQVKTNTHRQETKPGNQTSQSKPAGKEHRGVKKPRGNTGVESDQQTLYNSNGKYSNKPDLKDAGERNSPYDGVRGDITNNAEFKRGVAVTRILEDQGKPATTKNIPEYMLNELQNKRIVLPEMTKYETKIAKQFKAPYNHITLNNPIRQDPYFTMGEEIAENLRTRGIIPSTDNILTEMEYLIMYNKINHDEYKELHRVLKQLPDIDTPRNPYYDKDQEITMILEKQGQKVTTETINQYLLEELSNNEITGEEYEYCEEMIEKANKSYYNRKEIQAMGI